TVKEGALPTDLRHMHLPIAGAAASLVQPDEPGTERLHTQAAALPSGPTMPRTPRKPPKQSGDILEEGVQLVTAEPGLRSEQIQTKIGRPSVLVKSTLSTLRQQKRLWTEGIRRGTRYYATAAK